MDADPSIQATTPTKRRSGARFSLRELILAMTAICGIAAAFYTRRPFAPTSFLESFNPRDIVMPLVHAANPDHLNFASSGGGGSSYNGRTSTKEYQISFQAARPTAVESIAAIRKAVEAELARSGCEIYGRLEISDGAFGFDYEYGGSDGVVRVKGYQCGDRVEIDYFANEHQ